VMLTQTGQVKVMDFGIARALASGATTMTQTSAVIGTAQYLSPEQARGEAVDARSDVYATGCVLFELLTGQPPFVGDNPVSVAYQHVREDPHAPSEANPDVPPSVDAVVLKALAKNRANRYQSAGEMRGDVLRAAAGRPVIATPVLREPDPLPLAPPPPRVMGNRHTGTMARVGNQRRRQASTWVLVALSVLGVLAVVALGTGIYLASRTPTVAVPNLKGQSAAAANAALVNARLKGTPRNVTDPTCTANQVFNQSPGPGSKVPVGDVVTYDICVGPGKTTVPHLEDLSKDAAAANLKLADLVPAFVDVDSEKPAGTVVSSSPPANTVVDKNSTVTVSVSKGNKGPVPSVLGLSQNDAVAALHKAGFVNVLPKTRETQDPAKVNLVVQQSPPKDEVHLFTDTVTIFIGVAAPPSSPPSSPSTSPSA